MPCAILYSKKVGLYGKSLTFGEKYCESFRWALLAILLKILLDFSLPLFISAREDGSASNVAPSHVSISTQ